MRKITQDLEGNLSVGLLGGSFNPAHRGHLEVTDAARHLLSLDRVWWMVSPQNPLKDSGETAPLEERMAGAAELTRGRAWLSVTDIERQMGTQYTVDTLKALISRFPGNRFVWLMGADNLAGFHHWRAWREIAALVPIAVISRPGTGLAALSSPAAATLSRFRIGAEKAAILPHLVPPAWSYLPVVHNPLSSTDIRSGKTP